MSREKTKELLEMIKEGLIDKDNLIRDLLNYMSEDDVKEFMDSYGYNEEEE